MAAIPTALFTRSLGIGRIIAGIGPIVAPATAARRMGMSSTAEEPEAQVWSQLFGSRDVVLGALLLGAKDPAVRRAVVRGGLAIDTLDVVSGLRAGSGLSGTAKAAVTGGAAAAIVAGVLLELADRRAGRA